MARDTADPITDLLNRVRSGDDMAASLLWHEYSARVAAMARARLRSWQRSVQDDEDTANIVFSELFVALKNRSTDWVQDGEDLWKLLATITRRVTTKLRLTASRSNARFVSVHQRSSCEFCSPEQDPSEAVAFEDSLQELLRKLPVKLRCGLPAPYGRSHTQ